MLRTHKENVAYVTTTLARIDEWKKLQQVDNLNDYILLPCQALGMPRSNTNKKYSVVESAIFNQQLDHDELKQMIANEESRIYIKRLEVEQMRTALEGLKKTELYIVEQKYFENAFWSEIEYGFNIAFRNFHHVGINRIKQVRCQALDKLCRILAPFIEKYKAS